MKPEQNVEGQFEWDMTAVMLIVLVLVALAFVMLAIGPMGHVR